MTIKHIQRISIALVLLAGMLVTGYAQNTTPDKKQKPLAVQKTNAVKYKVTFIELGSVRCIPCQKMQSVMKSVREKYGKQVNVIFYDVWTPEGKPFGQQYAIQVIPTQVFLDENGKEFFRHEGYFPEEELIKVLKTKGVK
jgi:thioredoxin 1